VLTLFVDCRTGSLYYGNAFLSLNTGLFTVPPPNNSSSKPAYLASELENDIILGHSLHFFMSGSVWSRKSFN